MRRRGHARRHVRSAAGAVGWLSWPSAGSTSPTTAASWMPTVTSTRSSPVARGASRSGSTSTRTRRATSTAPTARSTAGRRADRRGSTCPCSRRSSPRCSRKPAPGGCGRVPRSTPWPASCGEWPTQPSPGARAPPAPGVPLRLLTNATLFQAPHVRAALADFDELWCKLDAGTEGYFHKVDGTRMPFSRILDNLLAVARERPIVIQALFLTWEGVGPDDAEVSAWAERLRVILDGGGSISLVQVYTVARPPSDARVGPLPLPRLE